MRSIWGASRDRAPAEPKTAINPPPRAAARGASRPSTAASERAVRVVDDDIERLASLDLLHASRDAVEPLETGAHGIRRQAPTPRPT